MAPSWDLRVPMQVDTEVIEAHVACMQQSYVKPCEHKAPAQVGKRPLEVGPRVVEVDEVLEVLSQSDEGFRAPSTSIRSLQKCPCQWCIG